MNFKLRATKGTSRRTFKRWLDETKCYRITWLRECFKVATPPHYFAMVRITLPDDHEMWDFVGRRGTYKTFKKAVEAANNHRNRWLQAQEATGIRELEKIFGKLPFGIPNNIRLKRNVLEILTTASQP